MLIEKTKKTYYEALQTSSFGWHEGQNTYAPFVKYYLGVIIKAYDEFEDRIQYLVTKKISKSDRIKAIISQTLGKISKKNLMERCPDISQETIERTFIDTRYQENRQIIITSNYSLDELRERMLKQTANTQNPADPDVVERIISQISGMTISLHFEGQDQRLRIIQESAVKPEPPERSVKNEMPLIATMDMFA